MTSKSQHYPPHYMAHALDEAEAAALRGEVPVGAVIVSDGVIVGRAGNRILELQDPTAHAEILAIREAGQILGSERLIGCDLYVTLEPCTMCAGAISLARINRLYFGASDKKGGGVLQGARFFSQPTCHHRPEIYDGIDEKRSETMLKAFFEKMR